MEAWLTFPGDDKPEDMVVLMEQYPQFKEMYQDVYDMCQNMEMFSKELKELDRNTVLYMIDEMQADLDKKDVTISEQSTTISEQKEALEYKDTTINVQKSSWKIKLQG